jgi:hypothetical protein
MTISEIVDSLNRTAACLLVAAERYPAKINDMRCLAVRLQIMAMDLSELPATDGPKPRLRLLG